MTHPEHPFAISLGPAVMAVCFLIVGLPAAHAEQAIKDDQPAKSGQHIALWDPPPAFVRGPHDSAMQVYLGTSDCPVVFRDSFDRGSLWQEGIFRTGFELPPEPAGTRIRYITQSGFLVQIDKYTITIQDPWAMNSYQSWGDPHENLNGKHIKDWGGLAGWDGSRRTILIDGGAKVTMDSAGPTSVVRLTSIYDGQQNMQIDNATNTILHQGIDAADTTAREAAQYDGETARFTVDTVTGIALFDNVSNEDSNFTVVPFAVPLGSTGGCANPGQVNDYFP